MKTRIIHTKIWDDDWFTELSENAQYLFFYLITNHRINLCGIYELPNKVILRETKIKARDLISAREELYPKVVFFCGWVWVVNAKRHGGYRGEKNDIACDREKAQIPSEIIKGLNEAKEDRVSVEYRYPSDTSINHKSEIINNKSNTIEEKKFENNLEKKFTLSEEEIRQLEIEFSLVDVRFEYAKAKDHLLANGGMRGKGEKVPVRDYKAYLRNWLRKDWVRKKPIIPVYAQKVEQTEISEDGLKKIEEIRKKLNFKVHK